MRRSFLERLQDPSSRTDERSHVIAHLAAVFNAKRGYSSFLPDLGLDTYQGRNALQKLEKDLEHDVARYEPRLVDPSLRTLGRDGERILHFELTGHVAGRPIRLRLRFNILMGSVELSEVTEP